MPKGTSRRIDVNVLAISDQPLTALALRSVLRRLDPMTVVEDASHLGEAMELLTGTRAFGLIVLDLDNHRPCEISTAALLRRMWPSIPLALLSSHECDTTIVRALSLGVSGYLLKTDDAETLHAAFSRILAGGVYMPEFDIA